MSWSAAPNPFRGAANNFISVIARILPASQTDTYMLPGTQPGPAELYFGPYDTTGKLFVNVRPVFKDGSFGAPIYFISNTSKPIDSTGQGNAQIYLPNFRIQVSVQNTDGAASHEYDLGLWPVGGTY